MTADHFNAGSFFGNYLFFPPERQNGSNECLKLVRLPGAAADEQSVDVLALDQFRRILRIHTSAIEQRDAAADFFAVQLHERRAHHAVLFFGIFLRRGHAVYADRPDRLIRDPDLRRVLGAHAVQTDFDLCPQYLVRESQRLLLASLREQGVPFCDVRDVLRNANSLTYYRTGSHWNGYGSALASEAFTMQPHRGDLFEMLYLASSRTEDGPALAHARSFSYADDFHAADDQRIRTSSAASGTLLMFRDSFGNALHADLAEDFGVALFSRAMPYDLSLMDDVQPDTLIVELVERNLCWLCTRPPLLPAPVREQTFDGATDFGTLDVTRSSAPWDDLSCYAGTFSTFMPDADAPVYVLADGACYEACPTEDGFQLLISPCESLTVYTVSGGEAICFQAVLSDANP